MECGVYEEISVEEALSGKTDECTHAAHVMVYAEWPGALFGKYPFKYAVMVSSYVPPTHVASCHGNANWSRCR